LKGCIACKGLRKTTNHKADADEVTEQLIVRPAGSMESVRHPCDIPPRLTAWTMPPRRVAAPCSTLRLREPRSRTLGRSILSFSALAQRSCLRFHWSWTR